MLAPATADLAAHTFRAALWEREGFVVWNAYWYGGHHVPGYSLLFPPPAAWLGPRAAGALAGALAVAAFCAVTPNRAARWLFASAVASNVVVGRMPFVSGVALATAAWAAADKAAAAGARARAAWRLGAAVGAAATSLASPVAGIFLATAALARAHGRLVLIAPAVLAGAALGALFPGGGTERFGAGAFWPLLALVLAAAALLDGRRRAGALLGAALVTAAFVLPTPMGQNAMRLPLLLVPVLLATAPRRGPLVAAVVAALVYLQWLPAYRAVVEAAGDPSTHAAFYDEVRDVARGQRVEVVFTHNHWEAAHLPPAVPIARGWERQTDRDVNAALYDPDLDARSYRRWLERRGVVFVALPAAALDYSARREAALLRAGVPGLREVHRSPRWRIWRVAGVRPAARVVAADEIEVLRPGVTPERWTRYWERGREGGGGSLAVARPGRIRARFRLSGG